jgi:hypothetical protein
MSIEVLLVMAVAVIVGALKLIGTYRRDKGRGGGDS